jgi:DNA sulfur modification protein DndD
VRISLQGWSAKGLRAPDIDIDLTDADGEPARVALVQMPNGTGKTTTLELLRAALSGEASEWTPAQIRELRRPGESNDEGHFRVTLLVDGKPVTFEILFDFEAGSAAYRTTTSSSGGVKRGWVPPPTILQFLNRAFLDLFIFDGEFADDLLKKGVGRADEAIGALCQLDLLDDVASTVELQWKRATSQGGPKSAAALDKLNKERDALLAHQANLKKAREAAQRKLDVGTAEAAALEKKIADKVGSVEATKSQHAEAQLALQTANGAVSTASGTVMSLLRMPLAVHPQFSARLVELKDNLDKLRLPETSSAQFFEDLVDDEECICGRPMTEGARTEIRKRAKGYLDYDESGTINALKHDIGLFVAPTEEESRHDQLQRALGELTSAKRQQKDAQQTLSRLTKKLIDAGDAELEAWKAALDQLSGELERCKQALLDIDATGEEEAGGPILSLKLVGKKLNEVKVKIAELSRTVELKNKTDKLNVILARAEALARETLRADLLHATNERLAVVLANDPLRVERIDRSLHLAHQGGASAGQKLSVGYTFLMSALSRGNNDFPLVVDSPAGPIDEGVRRNIGKLIPELCTQFVGFTINTERPGFVPALEKASDDCLFLTLFRRTAGTKRLERNLPAKGVTQTETATLVRDRDYFMSFDVTDEEDL